MTQQIIYTLPLPLCGKKCYLKTDWRTIVIWTKIQNSAFSADAYHRCQNLPAAALFLRNRRFPLKGSGYRRLWNNQSRARPWPTAVVLCCRSCIFHGLRLAVGNRRWRSFPPIGGDGCPPLQSCASFCGLGRLYRRSSRVPKVKH